MTAKLGIYFQKGKLLRFNAIADKLPRNSAGTGSQFDDVGVYPVLQDLRHCASNKRTGRK